MVRWTEWLARIAMGAFSNSTLSVICLTVSIGACGIHPPAPAPNAAVFIPTQHRNLRTEKSGNSIAFEIDEPFPADDLLISIENHYHPPDWSKVDELELFPGRRTSEFSAGWSEFSEK